MQIISLKGHETFKFKTYEKTRIHKNVLRQMGVHLNCKNLKLVTSNEDLFMFIEIE